MDARTPKAVVFDVGNTLWFEARTPDRGDIEALQAARVAPLVGKWKLALPVPLEAILRDVWDRYLHAWRAEHERHTHREPSLPSIIKSTLSALHVSIDDAQAQAWWRAAWINELDFGVQLYPDSLDVLRELKQDGLLVGINTTRPCTADMHVPGLRDMGIAPYVDAVVCSGDTGFAKPHPSTFELVLDKLAVSPHDAVMVGDSAEADMRGAKAVGMTTVWKLNGRYDLPPCPDADFQIHDLAELLALPPFGRPAAAVESLTPHEDGNAGRY